MKIAYIVPSLIKSGPIKVVHQLVETLQSEHEIELFYFKSPDREQLHFNVPTHKIAFRDEIDFDRFDIIHSHTIMADAYVWYHKNKIKKSKTVTTLHSYAKEELTFAYGKLKAFWMVKLWNLVTSKHDCVVTLSKDAVKYYKKIWHNKKLTYVYNGVSQIETPKKASTLSLPANKNMIKIGTIASAGGISRRKGIDQIIRVLVHLKNYELYIAGKETDESLNLKKLADKLGVGNRVHFLGFCSKIEAFIEEMDLFVIAPRSEGFSLALQEIASAKKAVVCSDIPIFKELMGEDEVCFFRLEDIESLKKSIEKAYANKEKYVKNAYLKYKKHYTPSQMARNYLTVYEKLQREDNGKN